MEDRYRILRLSDVEAMTGLRHSAIYDRVARGLFPRPVPLTTRCRGWLEHEVRAWIAERIAERDAAHSPIRQIASPEAA